MIYSLSHFWFWLFTIFVVGLTTSLLTKQAEKNGKISPWLIWCALAFCLGLLMALLNVLVGRGGVWLETGLASFACFMIGAGFGVLARGGSLREHRNWALGLAPCVLIWLAGNIFGLQRIEDGLKQTVGEAIKSAGGDPRNFEVDGRDILLPDSISADKELAATIAKIDGVRLVAGADREFGETRVEAPQSGQSEAGHPEKKSAHTDNKADAGWADAGKRDYGVSEQAPEAPRKTAEKKPHAEEGGAHRNADGLSKIVAGEAQSTKPPQSPMEKAKAAAAVLGRPPPKGPLDISTCQAAVDATQALDKIEFRSGSASIHRAAAYVLDGLAALLQRCPDAEVEIAGHTDNVGDEEDNRALSQRRADRVMQYLVNEGVAARRLTAVGHGAQKPIASNADEAGRSENRRIEFILK
jgi:outer membrane protein OmpA-like peptidoglycan-associated protein